MTQRGMGGSLLGLTFEFSPIGAAPAAAGSVNIGDKMDKEQLKCLALSAICGFLASFLTYVSSQRLDRRRLGELEAEVEGLSIKLQRRTQRENSEKAQSAKNSEQELIDFARENLQPSVPSSKNIKFHPSYKKTS